MKPANILKMRSASSAPPPTSYANAGGTGDRTASITVTAVSLSTGGGSLSGLVNGAQDNNYFWDSDTGVGTSWLLFDFGTAKYIDEFKWYQSTSATHGTWKFEGSNDNSSWTQCGSDFTLGDPSAGSGTAFSVPNSTAYRYYRLRHMSGDRFSGPYDREIEFKIA